MKLTGLKPNFYIENYKIDLNNVYYYTYSMCNFVSSNGSF